MSRKPDGPLRVAGPPPSLPRPRANRRRRGTRRAPGQASPRGTRRGGTPPPGRQARLPYRLVPTRELLTAAGTREDEGTTQPPAPQGATGRTQGHRPGRTRSRTNVGAQAAPGPPRPHRPAPHRGEGRSRGTCRGAERRECLLLRGPRPLPRREAGAGDRESGRMPHPAFHGGQDEERPCWP